MLLFGELASSNDNKIVFWDLHSGSKLRELEKPEDVADIWNMAVLPSGELATTHEFGGVQIWTPKA